MAAASKRDAVTNYEVDKTVKVVRSATGTIRRLNAAVVINHAAVAGADGKPVTQALSAQQMEQINALVRETIGFSQERGDSINVVNAPFLETALPPSPELPLWRQPETQQIARSLAPWIALPLVALMVLLGLVRPALRSARRAPIDAQPRLLDATVQDAVALPTPGTPGTPDIAALQAAQAADPSVPLLPTAQVAAQQARNRQLEGIRQLARQNPATVANVVRNWVSQPS